MDPNGQPKKPSIGRAEFELLEYVSAEGSVTVRQAADHFGRTRGWVRTTLLQMMERLRKKGYLARESVEGVFHYLPLQSADVVQRSLVERFVDESLSGCLSPLVVYLTEAKDVSDQELAQLRQLVRELEAKREGREP